MRQQVELLENNWTNNAAAASTCLGIAVFMACLFGIATRPADFLASVWPANAVMLGLLIRMPAAARLPGWLSASAAYMAADLLTGGTFFRSLLLNSANIVSVGTAYLIYARLPSHMSRLRDPASMLYLVLAAALAAAAAGIIGGAINPALFDGGMLSGWAFWFTTEFVNYIAILPVILAAPSMLERHGCSPKRMVWPSAPNAAPVAALVLSCGAGVLVGGLGAIAFPVPALLWCGLTYPVFPTAVLTLLFGAWTLVAISTGLLPGPVLSTDEFAVASARLGTSLIAVAPVMLATVMASRNELLSRMQHLATHDVLTGTLNRGAFLEKARRQLNVAGPVGVLMVDLDHFKQINDTYGHAAGDEVLVACAGRLQSCLRPGDVLGRLGGEEFAVLMSAQSEPEVTAVAERVRSAIADSPVALSDGRRIPATASLGAAFASPPLVPISIDALLANADIALYSAKRLGRNRIEKFDPTSTSNAT